MVQATWPPTVQVLSGQIQDNLAEWVKRDPTRPRWETLRHGERALHLLGDLIKRLTGVYEELGQEVEQYRDAVRKVGT